MVRRTLLVLGAFAAFAAVAGPADAEEAGGGGGDTTPPATAPAPAGETQGAVAGEAPETGQPAPTPPAEEQETPAPAPEAAPTPAPVVDVAPPPPPEAPAAPEEAIDPALAARIEQQVDDDPRPIPAGQGALFVPALTDPILEPAVEVFRDGDMVASEPPASKIFLPPGRYLVRVGRGNDRVRPSFEADVTEGSMTTIVPTWGALVIDVVDDHGIPHRGAYDLIRLDTRETVGQGRGADRRTGEGLRTWLLIPGVYKIVQPGGTYRERVDFVTVRVLPGEAIDFTLVVDRANGEFRGGGISPREAPTTVRGLELNGAFGGSLQLTHRQDVPGATNGITFGGDLFLDFDLLYDEGWNYLSTQLQIEAGMLLLPDEEHAWRKTLDYADLAAIYIFQYNRLIGPYVSLTYNTNLIPGYDYFENDRRVQLWTESTRDADPEPIGTPATEDRVSLSRSFSRNDVREGIGANWRAFRSRYLDLDVRLGFGFQQLITHDLWDRAEDLDAAEPEPDGTIAYQRVATFTHREGVDVGVVAAGSLTGWLSYDLEFSLLEPLNSQERPEDDFIPIIDLDATITLRIFSFASLNYILRVRYDPVITDDAQIDQALLLRFAFNLF